MTAVFIEARPKGRDGDAIEDYVVEDRDARVLECFASEMEAARWARDRGYYPLVAFSRRLNDKKDPTHWRPVATETEVPETEIS